MESPSHLTSGKPINQGIAFGLGWLRFTCNEEFREELMKWLAENLGVEFIDRERGWNGYLKSWSGSGGILVASTPRMSHVQREELGLKKSPNEGKVTVDIPQSVLDGCNLKFHSVIWFKLLSIDSVKFNRIDIYCDDYKKRISPQELEKRIIDGSVGVPRVEQIKSWSKTSLRHSKSIGHTVYLGSEKSDKQVRYYDKFSESEGKQDCYRFEVQFVRAKAAAWKEVMLSALEKSLDCESESETANCVAAVYKSVLVGEVDFIDLSKGNQLGKQSANWASRGERCEWWKEIVANIEKWRLVVNRSKPSLAKGISWFKKQVVPLLSIVRTAYRHWQIPWNEWIFNQLEEGEERWSDRHWQILKEALVDYPAV